MRTSRPVRHYPHMATLTDLLRSHHEVRAALRTAIAEIERLQFGKADSSKLRLLRRVLTEARAVAAVVEEPMLTGEEYEVTEQAGQSGTCSTQP